MEKLNDEETSLIVGGAISMNATFLNAIARVISTVLDLGRTVGSSISRYKKKNYCS